ncbi:cilia- and flagella-associated protein 57-like isoform X2 [Teleopsis dalmanni]|uniref:cilia- and flagella-associated protein 57-like isoform X2 n=1 Tax=Teleopsis dalmanni TaxID=139649 RepID=UPI0018CD87C8|nr:cilia- and flagella-associated protein 57-like isoform X2 [Teleopsis dalmanni]
MLYRMNRNLCNRCKLIFIKLSYTKKCLATIEQYFRSLLIGIYDLRTLERRKEIPIPRTFGVRRIIDVTFSHDSRYLYILTEAEEYLILMLPLTETDFFIEGYPSCPGYHSAIVCISSDPSMGTRIAVGAEFYILIMTREPKSDELTITQTIRLDFRTISMSHFYSGCLIIGTDNNEIILIVNGKIKNRQNAHYAELLDSYLTQPQLEHERLKYELQDPKFVIEEKKVLHMFIHSTGLAYAIGHRVYVFEKVAVHKYERKTLLTVPRTMYDETFSPIHALTIDDRKETVVVTCQHPQIYIGIHIVPESLKTKRVDFAPLGALLHEKEITCAAVCTWKPVIMTGSKDFTVRIWNYKSCKVEVCCRYDDAIRDVALNNTGYLAAMAFTNEVRLVQIFVDDYLPVKKFHFPMCNSIKYANYGHILAAAYGNTVSLVSPYLFHVVHHLRGNNGNVMGISWTVDDRGIVSCADDGMICYWNVMNGQEIYKIETNQSFRAVCITTALPETIYAASQTGSIHVFQNKKKINEVRVPMRKRPLPLVDIVMFRSDQMLFAVNSKGEFYTIGLPLFMYNEPCFRVKLFVTRCNRILLSYDGLLLIAITDGGTLVVCSLENIEERLVPVDEVLLHRDDIVIPRKEVLKQRKNIKFLETKLKRAQREYMMQILQCEKTDIKHLNKVHRSYCTAVTELRTTNIELERRQHEELTQVNYQLDCIRHDQAKEMTALNEHYTDRMMAETTKFNNLRDELLSLRDEYGTKLLNAENTLIDTIPEFQEDFKKKLDHRRVLLREMMKLINDKKIEFFDYCRVTDDRNYKILIQTQVDFVEELKRQKNIRRATHAEHDLQEEIFHRFTSRKEMMERKIQMGKELYVTYAELKETLTKKYLALQIDYNDREHAIDQKEFRIVELGEKNESLEKFKYALDEKIIELHKAIAPKDVQIAEKIKHILEMEHELIGLHYSNEHLHLQLDEVKTRDMSYKKELATEKHRTRGARQCYADILTNIFDVNKTIEDPLELRREVKKFFERYANDNVLHEYLAVIPEEKDYFQRNRVCIENIVRSNDNVQRELDEKPMVKKFKRERRLLRRELRCLRSINKVLQENPEDENLFDILAALTHKLHRK